MSDQLLRNISLYGMLFLLSTTFFLLPIWLFFTDFIKTRYDHKYLNCLLYLVCPPALWYALIKDIVMSNRKISGFSAGITAAILCYLWFILLGGVMGTMVTAPKHAMWGPAFIWFYQPLIVIMAFTLYRNKNTSSIQDAD